MKLIKPLQYASLFGLSVKAVFQGFSQQPNQQLSFTQEYGVNCGNYVETGRRIVNGEVIHIKHAPWQIYLSRGKTNGAEFCGGTIISPHWVISAAHCEMSNPKKVYVYSGTSHEFPHTNDNGGDNNRVSDKINRWTTNPQYNDFTLENDIALIKMKKKWIFKDNDLNRKPACLPLHSFCAPEDTMFTVSGYGLDSSGGFGTIALNQAAVPVYSSDKCNDPGVTGYAAQGENIPYQSMFCAGGQGKDSCQGDSGGPIVLKNSEDDLATVVGVVSWGFGCNEAIHPGVYTNLANYVFWITHVTGVFVKDEDYQSTPQFDCEMNQKRGWDRNIVSTVPPPNEGEDYQNQIYENEAAMDLAGYDVDPFKKGTIRVQSMCVDWESMSDNTPSSLMGKRDKDCKKYSKNTVDFVKKI